MTTLSEEREINRRLKIESEVHKDFLTMNKEREDLRKENRQLARGGRPSAGERLKAAFTQTEQTISKPLKSSGRKSKTKTKPVSNEFNFGGGSDMFKQSESMFRRSI